MKKILMIITLFIIMMIPNVYAKDISIESISKESNSNSNIELHEPLIDGFSIKLDLSFKEKGEYIKYKIIINNETDKDYHIDENKNNSEYVKYSYQYDDSNYIIEKNKKSLIYLTITYDKEVPIEMFRENGLITENNVVSINFDNLNNPKTNTINVILILILILLGMLILFKLNKKNKMLILLLLLIPITVFAIEKITINLTANIKFTTNPICIRASKLNTESCNYSYYDNYYYCHGETFTYGNLGTKGVLNVGDAFDCDVNADGIYDPDEERFYYLSPEDADESSDNIVLIYNNNVSDGISDSSATCSYSDSKDDFYHYPGPRTAYQELPSMEQWSNKLLFNNFDRQIKTKFGMNYINSDGTTYYLEKFVYYNKSSRLVTYQEYAYKCENKIATDCTFLVENSIYMTPRLAQGYWLESYSNGYPWVYHLRCDILRIDSGVQISAANLYGTRPVIVVSKNNIAY